MEKELKSALAYASKKVSVQDIFIDRDVGSRSIWATATELLFLLAPLGVILLLLALQEKLQVSKVMALSDLSLLSTFIFGQAAIKAFQFPVDTFVLKGNEVIVGLGAFVICFGVLPSAVIFSLSFVSENKSNLILWLQPVFLIISIVTYSFFAFILNAANLIKFEASCSIVEKTLDKMNEGND